jgi:hypothetical protein
MYERTRGGTRGGKDRFSWEAVKDDKHRQNYLGHSLMAPIGRWQKGKDLSWYAKSSPSSSSAVAPDDAETIRRHEKDMILEQLGLRPRSKRKPAPLTRHDLKQVLKGSDEYTESSNRVSGLGFEP